MLTIRQKAVATALVAVVNLAVLAFLDWFVVLTAVPSLLFLGAVLRR